MLLCPLQHVSRFIHNIINRNVYCTRLTVLVDHFIKIKKYIAVYMLHN